jgi:hypothetical protein
MARSRQELEKLFSSRLSEDERELMEPAQDEDEVDLSASAVGGAPRGKVSGELQEPADNEREIPSLAPAPAPPNAATLVARCRELMPTLHADDQEEALGLIEAVEDAQNGQDPVLVEKAAAALSEFLFFVEGR